MLNLFLTNEHLPVLCNRQNVSAEFVLSKLDVTSSVLTCRCGARDEYSAVTDQHPATGLLLRFAPAPLIKLYLSNKRTGAL
jgi:hypothetical protein